MTTIVVLSLPPPSSFHLLLLLLLFLFLLRRTLLPFHIASGSTTTLRVGEQLRHRLPCDSQPPASVHLLYLFLFLLRVIRCSRLHSHHLQHIPPLPTLDSKPRCVPHLSNDLLLMLYQLNPANRLRVCNSAGWLPSFLRM